MKEKSFGAFLKESREFLGISQEVLAERLGISKSMVSKYEQGLADDKEGNAKRKKLIRQVKDLVARQEKIDKGLGEVPMAQESEFTRRIHELEDQIKELNKMIVKINNKIGIT